MASIKIAVSPDDDGDIDATDQSGLTGPAYERLVEAIASAGFSLVEGPSRG